MKGMFLDRPLLDWLQKYTFPSEKRFADGAYAEKVYPYVISFGEVLLNFLSCNFYRKLAF